MKLAALVSGGKDSVLALHCAQSSGWDVTHVVTVRPRVEDSYMFHAPNTHLGPAIARALGLPHVEVATAGEKERELADLESALGALAIEGFVSGAVASEYQRTRLERIGHRLGLKSFAPLWHKRPEEILRTVSGPAWDVRFAAVAAEGLGEDWLGARLDASRVARLLALRDRVGLHPAGEGGEYETLVLDAPCYRSPIGVGRASPKWRRDHGAWHVEETRAGPPKSPAYL